MTNTQTIFPNTQLSTKDFFGMEANRMDLGSITRGVFTQYKRVQIEGLHPRQTMLDGSTLNYKWRGKGFTVPCVVITRDCNILIDGHHTTVVKKLKGQKYIMANVYDYRPTQDKYYPQQ